MNEDPFYILFFEVENSLCENNWVWNGLNVVQFWPSKESVNSSFLRVSNKYWSKVSGHCFVDQPLSRSQSQINPVLQFFLTGRKPELLLLVPI